MSAGPARALICSSCVGGIGRILHKVMASQQKDCADGNRRRLSIYRAEALFHSLPTCREFLGRARM